MISIYYYWSPGGENQNYGLALVQWEALLLAPFIAFYAHIMQLLATRTASVTFPPIIL